MSKPKIVLEYTNISSKFCVGAYLHVIVDFLCLSFCRIMTWAKQVAGDVQVARGVAGDVQVARGVVGVLPEAGLELHFLRRSCIFVSFEEREANVVFLVVAAAGVQ